MLEILKEEVEAQTTVVKSARKKIDDGLELSPEARSIFERAELMLSQAQLFLDSGDKKKTLYFLIRAVANYYLCLGLRGVIPKSQS